MSFIRKSLVVSLGQVASVMFSVGGGIILSRALKPDGMGQYELFRNTAILISCIGTLGLGQANIFFLNNRNVPYSQIVTDSLRVGVLAGVLFGGLLVIAVKLIPGYFGPLGWASVLSYGVVTALIILRNLLRPILVAQLKATPMAIVDASQPAFVLLASLGLLAWGRLTTAAGILLFTGGIAVSVGMLLYYVAPHIQPRVRFAGRIFRELLWYGVKLGAANVLLILSSSLTILVLRKLSPGEFTAIGLYTRAAAITALAMVMPIAIGPMLYSKWASAPPETVAPQVEFAMRAHFAYGLCVAVSLAVFGRLVIFVLYGRPYLPAHTALAILGFATAVLCFTEPLVQLLAGTGRAGTFLLVLTVAFVVLVLSLVVLVPLFGIEGAAVAVFISNVSALVFAMRTATRIAGVRAMRCFLFTPADLQHVLNSLRTTSPTTPAIEISQPQ